ncbi:MAG: MerR family transcriptional regulator [Gammaproteobacteria bacterium]|nr:MAG: MerR family transcriptional regulator [Gammaproteobacteria bacterium]
MPAKNQKNKNSLSRIKRRQKIAKSLPVIPNKLYFTISEVSDLCAVKAYVLRYWEQEFPQLRPLKRRGNRRYYQPNDVLLVRQIRKLLYEDGFTIEGARAQLSHSHVPPLSPAVGASSAQAKMIVRKLITDLEIVLQSLQADMKLSPKIN